MAVTAVLPWLVREIGILRSKPNTRSARTDEGERLIALDAPTLVGYSTYLSIGGLISD